MSRTIITVAIIVIASLLVYEAALALRASVLDALEPARQINGRWYG